MAIVSRLELNHPALGTAGGSALHTSIEDIYKKLGDNIADRFFYIKDLNAAASADCDHNFNTAIDNLKFDVYGWNEGTGELTYLTELTTPKLSEISIIAKVGDEKTQVTLTNNSSAQVDLGLVINQQVIKLSEGDIKDVDISSVAPEDGQALVYESSSSKFKPGASGDSSFKFQKLTGTVLTIKKGYLVLSSGEEIYSSVDLSPDLATFIPGADGDYYGYFDRYLFPDFTTVNGRKLLAMTTAQLVFSTTTPDLISLGRYIPLGKVQKSSGSFANIETLATRRHDVALGVDGSLLDSLEYTLIGAVGDAAQLNSGHQLAASSFPSAAIGLNLSWYNLPDVNDDSGNARNLTPIGSPVFTGSGILGDANNCLTLDGATQYLYWNSSSFMNPGDIDFQCGGWFYKDWSGSVAALFGQWQPGAKSFLLNVNSTDFIINYSTNGSTELFASIAHNFTSSQWLHIVLKYVASTNTFYLYVNGVNAGQISIASGLYASGNGTFIIGSNQGTSQFLLGKVDEFFFCNNTAFSDNDIMKIQAAKYAHNKGVASNSQDWKWWIKTATDAQRRLDYDPIISAELNELFFDLSQEATTALISRKLFNAGQTGLAKPARGQTLTLTTDQLDSILPITHNCGGVPNLSFLVSNGTDYETQDVGSIFKQDATQIKIAGDSLVTLYGTGINVILSYSSGVPSVFVPNRFWNNRNASSAIALAVNDRVFADAATTFVATLPASPSVGDEVQILDAKGTFGVGNYVTINPGASNLRGGANTFDCNQPNKLYRAIFVDATYGWDILY